MYANNMSIIFNAFFVIGYDVYSRIQVQYFQSSRVESPGEARNDEYSNGVQIDQSTNVRTNQMNQLINAKKFGKELALTFLVLEVHIKTLQLLGLSQPLFFGLHQPFLKLKSIHI